LPNVIQITYTCQRCGIELEDISSFICECGGEFKGTGMPGITGGRDNFGIRREFYDIKTGKYIDNFKSWERAGFKEPGAVDGRNSKFIKEKVKELKKEKTYPTRTKALNIAESI
jgi:hypothetical protein